MMDEDFAATDRKLLSALVDRGFRPSCVFDVGGSDGAWTRTVADLFPDATFELFEPLSDHVEEYRGPMAALLASDERFHLHRAAVGEEPGTCQINLFPNAVGSTTLTLAYQLDDVVIIPVDQLSIDDLVQNQNIPIPQLIKMDIQGGEMAALRGAAQTLPYVDALLLETWLTRGYGSTTPLLGELIEFLRTYGFFLAEFGDEYRTDDGVLVSKDCLFLNAASPYSPLYQAPVAEVAAEPTVPVPDKVDSPVDSPFEHSELGSGVSAEVA